MRKQLRTYGYFLALLLLVLVVGWAGRVSWLEFRKLQGSFRAAQPDAFQVSEHIQRSIGDLNGLVLHFERDNHPEDRTVVLQKAKELQRWIHSHQATVTTAEERDWLGRIEVEYEQYVGRISELMALGAPSGAPQSPPMPKLLEDYSESVLTLCGQLNEAEGAAQTQFLKDSHGALVWLQELMVVQMALLGVMIGTGIVAVYRGVIGPLRVELWRSRARAARNEKLASLGTLAAGVAHEIRNPLTAINVRLHSLKKNLVNDSSEQEDALVIGHEIQRLENIVQGFLRFARPADPKFLTVSVDSLLSKIQKLFAPQMEKSNLQLILEAVPDIWVQVDPHQMEQVLINLVRNAMESMAVAGAITIRVRSGNSRLQGKAGAGVVFEVSDTGQGMPPEVLQRIFDPFFTTKDEGTGLGLAIAERIVEKHGGRLECRSEPNRGTTFTITLPGVTPDHPNEP